MRHAIEFCISTANANGNLSIFAVLRAMASSMLVILLLLGLNIAAVDVRMLRVVTQWSFVDFNFPSEIHRNDAILRRQFIPGNTVPIDVDVHYKGSKLSSFVSHNFYQFLLFFLPLLSFRPFSCICNISQISRWHSDNAWYDIKEEINRWLISYRSISRLQLASQSNARLCQQNDFGFPDRCQLIFSSS